MYTEMSDQKLLWALMDVQNTLRVLLVSVQTWGENVTTGEAIAIRAAIVDEIDGGSRVPDGFRRDLIKLAELGLCEASHVAILREAKKRGLKIPSLKEARP